MAESTSATLSEEKKMPHMQVQPRYPLDAELFPAENLKYNETVLIVPFYGSKKPQVQRHVDMLNDLGFNVVTYDQTFSSINVLPQIMSSREGLGFKHVWADQVEGLLNAIPGNKIVYGLSNPSSGAIEAIGRRHATDIKGLIVDGGPTARFFKSIVKYLTTEEPIPTKVLRFAMAGLTTALWTPDFAKTLSRDLKKFPKGFPVLSIRGWKDRLIPPSHIDMVFEPHPHLAWQKLSLPEADHLNGLRDFPDEYIPAVKSFLESIATPSR